MNDVTYIYGRDFERFAGGAESYVVAHCMAASALGFDPLWFALGHRAEYVDFEYGTLRRMRSPGSGRGEYATFYSRLMTKPIVRALSTGSGPVLLHSFGAWISIGASVARSLRSRGTEVTHVSSCFELLGPHTAAKLDNALVRGDRRRFFKQRAAYEFVRRVSVPAERAAMRECDAVIVNYDRLRDLIHAEYGREINVVKLPYAAGTAFEPVALDVPPPPALAGLEPNGAPLIVCTSRHMPRKGVDLLINALAGLRDEGIEFRAALVGTGDLLDDHREMVSALDLGDRVALPGRVPDVRPFLAHADLFVLPSIAEGSGSMSALEALQYGVPVVSFAVDGIVEDFVDGENALLARAGDVGDLRRALREAITNPRLRERLSASGAMLHQRRFSAKAATDALGEFYAELGFAPSAAPAPLSAI